MFRIGLHSVNVRVWLEPTTPRPLSKKHWVIATMMLWIDYINVQFGFSPKKIAVMQIKFIDIVFRFINKFMYNLYHIGMHEKMKTWDNMHNQI